MLTKVAFSLLRLLDNSLRRQLIVVICLSILASYSEIITLAIVYSAVQSVTRPSVVHSKTGSTDFIYDFVTRYPSYVVLLAISAIFALSILIRILVLERQADLSARFGALLGSSLYAHLISMEINNFKKLSFPDFNSLITKEADLIVYGFQGLLSVASNSILVLSVLAFLIWISASTTSFVLFLVPALFFLAFYPARKKVVRFTRDLTKSHNAFLQMVQWTLYDIFSIKIEDKSTQLIRQFRRVYFLRRKSEQLIGFYQQLPRILIESSLFLLIVLLFVLFKGSPSLVTGLIFTLFGSLRLFSPLNQIFVSYSNLEACRKSLLSYLAWSGNISAYKLPELAMFRHSNARDISTKLDCIALSGISYAYPLSSVSVSADLLVLNSGDSLLIYGPSGSGKTTLLNIIAGLLTPDSGSIVINSVPQSTFQLRQFWKTRLAYVPQEVLLYGSSISAYLQCSSMDINSITLRRVFEAVLLLSDFENGKLCIESCLGERGSLLSGGQRQRLSIAKSLLKSPQLLVLDEPTSALDPLASSLLISSIQRSFPGIVIIAVSHDPQLLPFFKRHWELNANGHVLDVSLT